MAEFQFTFTQETICVKSHKKRWIKLSQLLIQLPDPVLRLHIRNSIFRNMYDGMMDLSFYLWLIILHCLNKHTEHVPWGNYISIHPTIWSKQCTAGVHKFQYQLTWVTRFCMVAPNICGSWVWNLLLVTLMTPGILRWLLHYSNFCGPLHSFHWHVQNAMIPCRSQEVFPFLSVMYFFLPPFSTNYASIAHLILTSVSWSASQSCCSQIHIQGVPGGKDLTSGECSLGQTITI